MEAQPQKQVSRADKIKLLKGFANKTLDAKALWELIKPPQHYFFVDGIDINIYNQEWKDSIRECDTVIVFKEEKTYPNVDGNAPLSDYSP